MADGDPASAAPGPDQSLEQLAERLGRSLRTLQRWRNRGWDGDPATVDAFRERELRRRGPPRLAPRTDHIPAAAGESLTDASGDPIARETARFRRLKNEQLELQIAQMRGELVPVADVQRLFVARVAEVRAALVHLPRQLARRLANQTAEVVEDELDAEIRKVLERFARGDRVLAQQASAKRERRP